MQAEKDPQMWELAKRRASFKYHLISYLVFNAFFWILWYFTGRQHQHEGLPWPVWPAFGWGIGLIFHYLGAFVFSKEDGVQKEYDKLMRNKQS